MTYTMGRDEVVAAIWISNVQGEVVGAVTALYTERDALTERLKAVEAENERLKQLARRTVCSLGSYDRSLSEYYETALNATGEGHE